MLAKFDLMKVFVGFTKLQDTWKTAIAFSNKHIILEVIKTHNLYNLPVLFFLIDTNFLDDKTNFHLLS